jgi:Bacterial sugar transferase
VEPLVGLVGSLLFFAAGVVRQFLSKEITDELHSRIPWLTRKIVEQAIRRLPEEQKERFREEWHSHLEETPGELSKLITAIGFLKAARQMSAISGRKRLLRLVDIVGALMIAAYFSPALLLLVAVLKLMNAGSVLHRRTVTVDNRSFEMYTLRTRGSSPVMNRFDGILRRSGTATLPYLLNVIRGDIPLFGRRGYVWFFLKHFWRKRNDEN